MRYLKLFLMLIVSIVIGGLFAYSTKNFSLFYFPLIISVIVFILVEKLLSEFKPYLFYVTLILGLFIYSSFILTNYGMFKMDLKDQVNILIKNVSLTQEQVQEQYDKTESKYLEEATGKTGFTGFMLNRSRREKLSDGLNSEEKKYGPSVIGIMIEVFTFFSLAILPALLIRNRESPLYK